MELSKTALIIAVICAPFLATQSTAQEYEIVDLGTLGGSISVANRITENGIIAGYATTAPGVKHPVLWVNRAIQDLGAPPGFNVGEAVAANDAGQAAVVGEGSPQSYRGFLWDDDGWTDLGLLPDRNECIPEDINGAGRIVGTCLTLGGGNSAAFLWESGEMMDLGTLSGTARAYDINEMGQVAGHAWANQAGGNGEQRAFLWEAGTMTELPPLQGRDNSQAFGLNDLGEVAGSSWYPTGPYSLSVDRATLWIAGAEPVDLDYTPGPPVCSINPFYPDNVARAVNNHGEVVGHAQCIASGGSLAAFLWRDGSMHNLNDLVPPDSGWDLIKALDINDAGEIVGFGIAPGGGLYLRAFLLVPTSSSVSDGGSGVVSRSASLRCYPSPFKPRTTVAFTVDRRRHARIAVYDLAGRKVTVLADRIFETGDHSLVWDGRDASGRTLPSGTYFVRLETESGVEAGKVTLVR